MKQFRIPEGTRDVMPSQCRTKEQLTFKVEQIFDRYGYDKIATPSIEFYQTYQIGFAQVSDEQMYKFFDHNGNILTLRVDMTVPIARLVASKFKDRKPPFRLRYCAEVFKVKEYLAGKRNEISDCGVELIGLHDWESDIEILECAMEVMLATCPSSFTLEIGDVNFFMNACHCAGLKEVERRKLADLIDRKSMVELECYLHQLALPDDAQAFFLQLPWLCGDASILEQAESYCCYKDCKKVLQHLRELDEALCALGYQAHITYDVGKVPHLNYYSGIIFDGYVEGVGSSILSGGRYDALLAKFHYPMPAIGFSIKLDRLLELQEGAKEAPTQILCYPPDQRVQALKWAKQLRKTSRVKLLPQERDDMVVIKEEDGCQSQSH